MTEPVRAVRLHAPGGEPCVDRLDPPPAGADTVLVRMAYAGVNPIDSYVRAGAVGDPANLPRILGVEGVGEVDGRLHVVYGAGVGIARDGTWTQLAAVPPAALVPVPDGVDPLQAASAGVVGVTAVRAVDDCARLTPADRVLVLGAGGGVGSAAVSLARSRGATVFGQVSGEHKADLVASLGAEPVIAADPGALRARLGGLAVTVALDPLGGDWTGVLVDALPVGGRLVSYGVSAGAQVRLDMRALYRKNLTVTGYGGVTQPPERIRDGIGRALRALADRSMTIPVHAVLPMADAGKALTAIAERTPRGKLVLDLQQ